MKCVIHVTTSNERCLTLFTYLNTIINNSCIEKIHCYTDDINLTQLAVNLVDEPYQSLIDLNKSDPSGFTDFNTTLTKYATDTDIWILIIKDNIVYPESLIETYEQIIDTNSIKYAYGLFGYMFDNSVIDNMPELIHVLDERFSCCYHRSYFTEKWQEYITKLSLFMNFETESDIIMSNWFAINKIQRFQIDVPWCSSNTIKSLNSNLPVISNDLFINSVSMLQKHKIFSIVDIKPLKNTIDINLSLKHYNMNRPITKYEHIALLLESRYDPSYELMMRQTLRFLPNNFRIVLMVTPDVLQKWHQLTMKLTGGKLHPGIIVFPLKSKLTSVQDYNNIMLDINFWKQFVPQYKKVLIFQTDTMMFKYGLEQYMKYDYIGAPWPLDYGLAKGVGNGGFSLRSIQAMIKCLEKKDKIKIPLYTNSEKNLETFNGVHPEDVFYCFGMDQLKYNVAPPNMASYFANESSMYNLYTLGSHQLSKFNPTLYDKCLNDSIIPYNHVLHCGVGTHRYGWINVKENLDVIFNNPNGIQFRSYGDVNVNSYLTKEWVGVFHLVPINTKKYHDEHNLNNYKNNQFFLHNITLCKGVFTLSNYVTKIWKKTFQTLGLDIPVDTVYHPIEFDGGEFNSDLIDTMKTVVFIGSQIRRPSTIFRLNLPTYRKVWLPGMKSESAYKRLEDECEEFSIKLTEEQKKSVEVLYLSNEEYDALVNNSFIIVHQINASANNAVIEAIARNIPIFCNRLEATEEYLGKDYPLFFEDIEHLEQLLQDKATIRKAYDYLKSRQDLKDRLKMDTFVSGILNSHITKRLLTQKIPHFVETFNELVL
uniref:DUF5672 domain-containing protein n=1 Tax=viral metagenome TaxID=1070528 RepID=A0A6C0AQJ7_9ZZZZ